MGNSWAFIHGNRLTIIKEVLTSGFKKLVMELKVPES